MLFAGDDRREGEPHAEFSKLDRDRAGIGAALQDRDGKFAAHQEAGFFAVAGDSVGSSKICRMLRCSSAWISAPRFRSGRKAKIFSAFEMLNMELVDPPLAWTVLGEGAGNCPVVTRPIVLVAPVDSRLTAN